MAGGSRDCFGQDVPRNDIFGMNAPPSSAAVIGAGPAGLMAAEVLSNAGVEVDLYDRMPSVGRKLLMAGKGGLNITHSEPLSAFMSRYGTRRAQLEPFLHAFGPDALREWVHALGIKTFVGSSGRVFPHEMKAAPLFRAWLHRLRAAGVKIHARHCWCGWSADGALEFSTPDGERRSSPDATVLALGGASWPQLGSDAAWVEHLIARGVSIATLKPANCGFDIEWSDHFRARFAGQPLKSVVALFTDHRGVPHHRKGELLVTDYGIEGGLVYALSADLRDHIEAHGPATLHLDLAPGWDVPRLAEALSRPRGSRSLSSHVQSRTGIKGVRMGLLREVLGADGVADTQRLASTIKALALKLIRPRPVEEALSTAGGVSFEVLDEHLMLRALPGVFCAGEMLDWEAPTGGYLLTACFATGRAAGLGAAGWLTKSASVPA
jgi:uncharacterized flavoprotein (TIGR03862 family)